MPQWWSSVKLKKFRISSVFSLRFRLRWSCWKFFSSFFFHPSHLVGLRCWNNEGLEAEIDLKKQVRRPSEKKSEVRWRYDDEDSGRKPKLVEKLDRYFPPSIRSGGYFVGEDIILFFFGLSSVIWEGVPWRTRVPFRADEKTKKKCNFLTVQRHLNPHTIVCGEKKTVISFLFVPLGGGSSTTYVRA